MCVCVCDGGNMVWRNGRGIKDMGVVRLLFLYKDSPLRVWWWDVCVFIDGK